MPHITANFIDIYYEVVPACGVLAWPSNGSIQEVPDTCQLLLIQGLGGQLISWNSLFISELSSRGLELILLDNRDSGLSTKFDGSEDRPTSYTVEDMADDVMGLVGALGIDSLHVLGGSMGGMIAQSFSIRFPEKVRSLCSIMSTTGAPGLLSPTPEVVAALTRKPEFKRERVISSGLDTWRLIWGSGYDFEDEYVANKIASEFDRSFYPQGVGRQLAAIMSSPDRTDGLASLKLETLVIHGQDDPLISIAGGQATHQAISGSKFVSYPGMGHSMPGPLIAPIVDQIVANVCRAELALRSQ